MRKTPSQDALARRALIEDIRSDRRGWLQHGVAALAVSVLGLGVAGSVTLTSSAEHTQVADPAVAAPAAVATVTDPAADTVAEASTPAAFARTADRTSRSTARVELDAARLTSLADQRAEQLSKTEDEIAQAASSDAADARAKALRSTSESTQEKAAELAERRTKAAAERRAAASAPAQSTTGSTPSDATPATAANDGESCLPVRGGYRIAARFGQVGIWARYHTGFDFSAPIGTTLQAPAAGVVTNAGQGKASSWAGNYVAIRYPDGTQSLMAHMSTVAVKVGDTVAGCQVVGAVGMTGRTFGPHVHFEIYPAGITPGDVYKAVDPQAWLKAHRLNP